MKTYLAFITLISLFAMTSCGSVSDDSGQTQQVPVPPPNPEQTDPANTTASQQGQSETPLQVSAGQNSPGVMLNPPHGEPYHRCDIPVGDPLPSAPANSPRQTTTNQVQATTPQPPAPAPGVVNNPNPMGANTGQLNPSQNQVPAADGGKPQLNPPHGQPYHRCDIAVGSPLP